MAQRFPPTISQHRAAQLLAVSDTSIARYLDAGILPGIPGAGRAPAIPIDLLHAAIERVTIRGRGGIR
jgi:hypothetical protein